MDSAEAKGLPAIKLSICITTFNREAFIGLTLRSIFHQLTGECEVVILDVSDSERTKEIVLELSSADGVAGLVRYVGPEENRGIDQDYDRVVQLARGEFCWLMTDDDLLKAGAISTVLEALRNDVSLVVVNVESRDLSLSSVLSTRWLHVQSDRVYTPAQMDHLFVDLGDYLKYVGFIIVRRSVWIERDREPFYGTWFLYVAVIFQRTLPGNAVVISRPFISYRQGNAHSWMPRVVEINFSKWPSLVAVLALSRFAIDRVKSVEPWRHPSWLFFLRALGYYSIREYHKWIRPRISSSRSRFLPLLVALFPGMIANTFCLVYYAAQKDRGNWVRWVQESDFFIGNQTAVKLAQRFLKRLGRRGGMKRAHR